MKNVVNEIHINMQMKLCLPAKRLTHGDAYYYKADIIEYQDGSENFTWTIIVNIANYMGVKKKVSK